MGVFICSTCGNSDSKKIGLRNGVEYCRQCLSFCGADAYSNYYPNNDTEPYLEYELTDKQKEIGNNLIEAFRNERNSIVAAVCGAGKTEITIPLIHHALINNLRIGFCIPRKDVVIELENRFKSIFINNSVGSVYGGHNSDLNFDLIVLTCHQLYRYNNYFDLLILDELDAFPYKNNDMLTHMFKRSVKGNYVLMSATLTEKEKETYKQDNFQVCELNRRFHNYDLPVPRIIKKSGVLKLIYILRKLNEYKNKPCLIFVPTIKVSKNLYLFLSIFNKNGNYVNSLKEDRNKVIEDFRNKKYKFLVTTSVLERGVTLPNLQVIIYDAFSPIYDTSTLIQISGRVGRKKDYPTGEIIYLSYKITENMKESINEIIKLNEK